MASVLWNWQMLDADGVWGERSDYEATIKRGVGMMQKSNAIKKLMKP